MDLWEQEGRQGGLWLSSMRDVGGPEGVGAMETENSGQIEKHLGCRIDRTYRWTSVREMGWVQRIRVQ